MSLRNAVSMRRTSAGAGTGVARLPSTRPLCVTYCGRPLGPGMKLPYGSAAIIGMLLTSRSTNCRPSLVAACSLIIAQLARPPSADERNLPVVTGTPVDRVVLTQEDLVRRVRGVGLALVDVRRVGVGRVALAVAVDDGRAAGQHHERLARRHLVAVAGDAIGAGDASGSSAFSGTNTVPLPPLVILSRPWSKN